MRELTEQEQRDRDKLFFQAQGQIGLNQQQGFDYGFVFGLNYQQRKLDAYAAYVAGKITQKELEEVINGNG